MQFTLLSIAVLLASSTSAANIVATNGCGGSIFIKTDASSFNGPVNEIRPGQSYTQNLETSRQGNAVKFSNNANDFTKPISFDYSVSNGLTYYDVSNAAGQPFSLSAQDTQGGNGACPQVSCPNGTCKQVRTCSSQRSFQIRAC